jgi:hypothetical protein
MIVGSKPVKPYERQGENMRREKDMLVLVRSTANLTSIVSDERER